MRADTGMVYHISITCFLHWVAFLPCISISIFFFIMLPPCKRFADSSFMYIVLQEYPVPYQSSPRDCFVF